jgi:hypothetical protein
MPPPRAARRAILSSSIALVALALGGCGGGSKPSGPKLDAHFTQRVNAVCASELAFVNSKGPFPYPKFDPLHPDRALLPRVASALERVVPHAQALPAKLRALGEPAAARGEWDRVRSLIAQAKRSSARQVAFARASSVTGFAAESRTANRLHNLITAQGRAIGFPKSSPCSQIF